MMNWEKHRYTNSQVRLHTTTRRWQSSEYGGPALENREVLRWHLPPKKLHPAYRRRRRKHPAYYSIRYIRNSKGRAQKLAWFRYHKTIEEKQFSFQGRRRRHPLLQTGQ